MYSKNTYLIAAALVLLTACQAEKQFQSELKEDITEQRESPKTKAPDIMAMQGDNKSTKSTLEVDGEGVGTIYWTPADEINVFYGTTSTHYVSQNTVNATTAVFTTTDVIGSTESASENIWGLYPYNSSATCTGSAVTTTLPATQYGVPGTFDDDLFITVAHNITTALTFYNVCGGIKFSLSRNDITSITFRGNNNEDIAGEISLAFSEGLPTISVTSGVKEITLTPKTGSTFVSGEYYYLTVLPVTLSSGFTMEFTTDSGPTGTFNYTSKSVTIKRSFFGKKDLIDMYATGLPVPNNEIWYTSTDGSVVSTFGTAIYVFGANIISNDYYPAGQGRIIFDDAITQVGGNAFSNQSKLSSIILPEGVSTIENTAFVNCNHLSSITLPDGLSSIGFRAFMNCTSLTTINLPSSLSSLGSGAFMSCENLSSVYVNSCFTIYNNSFDGVPGGLIFYVDAISTWTGTRLEGTVPSYRLFIAGNELFYLNVASQDMLYEGCFKNCTSLKSVHISSTCSVPNYAFYGCSQLTTIGMEGTTIGNYSFANCAIAYLHIEYSNTTSIGDYAFANNPFANYLGINFRISTPPTLGSNVFDGSSSSIYIYKNYDDYYDDASWIPYRDRLVDWSYDD